MNFFAWGAPLPNQMQNFWTPPVVPHQPSIPSPQQQVSEFFQALYPVYESYLKQGIDYINQRQIEDLARLFALNPILAAMPASTPSIPANPLSNWFDTWPSPPSFNSQASVLPALGITREYQEDWATWSKLQTEFRSAYAEYLELFQAFGQNVGEKLTAVIGSSEHAHDFDQLCRKWIAICESEFQKIAITAEYSRRLAKLIDSSMRLQQQSNRIQEKFSQLLGYPSRTELNELHKSNSKFSTEIETMRLEIEHLKQTIETLRQPKGRPQKL